MLVRKYYKIEDHAGQIYHTAKKCLEFISFAESGILHPNEPWATNRKETVYGGGKGNNHNAHKVELN